MVFVSPFCRDSLIHDGKSERKAFWFLLLEQDSMSRAGLEEH
jgi:hypothetical protein